jgi:nicotinate-nucleotide adenylyltransferase
MKTTAIFGGTFNPFHIGHLKMLEALLCDDNIGEVFLMPDKIPPHKQCDFLASDEDRIEMCRIICEDYSRVKLQLIEFERNEKSYTYNTVLALKEKYPDKNFSFVIGGDMVESLDTWYKFDLLKKEISFLAFERKNLSGFEESVKKMRSLGADIRVIREDVPTISSTELRGNLNPDLLPKKIYSYIKEKDLYGAI